ncbi:MAG: lysylphosphatidylglycerol synthase transmembrane domain-containing protein [Anaerolineales bacterium]|nr:lysylphosphatidylglycerol synthase transmembrane domain-containing protein [Anaerolineales bacterium]
MKKLLLILVFTAAALFLLNRLAELDQIWETLRRGQPGWLLFAASLQVILLLNIAVSFRRIYRLFNMDEGIARLVHLTAAARFVNVVTPSLGASGMAVFVLDGRSRDLPGSRVSTSFVLYLLYDYLTFLIVLSLGLLILFRRHQLGPAEVAAAGLFGLAAFALAAVAATAIRNGGRLEQLLCTTGGWINRTLRSILKRDLLDLDRARSFAGDLNTSLQLVRHAGGQLLVPAGLILTSKAIHISVLLTVFHAFYQPYDLGILVAGFSLAHLALIVSPTPSGIGIVEGTMAIGLASLGVPGATATLIALAYRAITFWLPLLYGMLAFRWVGQHAQA